MPEYAEYPLLDPIERGQDDWTKELMRRLRLASVLGMDVVAPGAAIHEIAPPLPEAVPLSGLTGYIGRRERGWNPNIRLLARQRQMGLDVCERSMLQDLTPAFREVALHRFLPIYIYLEHHSEESIRIANLLMDELVEASDCTTVVQLPVLTGSWAGGKYARTRKRMKSSDQDAAARKFAGAVAEEFGKTEGAIVTPGTTVFVQAPGQKEPSGFDRIVSRMKELVALSTSILVLAGGVWIFAGKGKGPDSGRDKVVVTCMDRTSESHAIPSVIGAAKAEDLQHAYTGTTGAPSGMSCTITLPSQDETLGQTVERLRREVDELKKGKE